LRDERGRANAQLETLACGELVRGPTSELPGISRPRQVTLRRRDRRLIHAVFKPVSAEGAHRSPGSPPLYTREIAAYRLSEALGLRLVPPTVERTIDGEVGSLQLFVPGLQSLLELQPSRPAVSRAALDRLFAFDHILANVDRVSPGNMLFGRPPRGQTERPIVAIDHAHTFYDAWADWVFQTNVRILLQKVTASEAPSPDARRWIDSIVPGLVEETLIESGIDPPRAAQAAQRARALEQMGYPFAPGSR
jgi:hypothetical protein